MAFSAISPGGGGGYNVGSPPSNDPFAGVPFAGQRNALAAQGFAKLQGILSGRESVSRTAAMKTSGQRSVESFFRYGGGAGGGIGGAMARAAAERDVSVNVANARRDELQAMVSQAIALTPQPRSPMEIMQAQTAYIANQTASVELQLAKQKAAAELAKTKSVPGSAMYFGGAFR